MDGLRRNTILNLRDGRQDKHKQFRHKFLRNAKRLRCLKKRKATTYLTVLLRINTLVLELPSSKDSKKPKEVKVRQRSDM
jgi:hypothetical protein